MKTTEEEEKEREESAGAWYTVRREWLGMIVDDNRHKGDGFTTDGVAGMQTGKREGGVNGG
ncbi:cyclic pyranopterin monophosphate synthase accessory protein [Salmonella enterica]|nr:cyclic pyranopterin monophosphate synthase accessory protein [Salmonella enterica]